MSILTVSNEIILLIWQQLQSEKDLNALVQVNSRFYHLLNHLLYRYNLRHQNGDGILQAAKLGSIPAVAQFIKEGYLVRDRPIHGEHPPEHESRIRAPCSCRLEHPIFYAAKHGHSALVEYLLNAGSEPDFENNLGETPIHLAAKNGFLSVIKILLSRSTLFMDNDKTFTLAPIKEAILKGKTHVVEYLLSCSPCPSDSASSSLPFAAVSGDMALISMLLRYGADINYKYIERHAPWEPIDSRARRGDESTALSVAAAYGHLTLVNFLLANGSDVDVKTGFTDFWMTPLYLAVVNGYEEVIKVLLAHGANFDDEHLRGAVLKRHKRPLEILLAKSELEKCQFDLLELAVEIGEVEICQVLLDKGFDQEKAVLKAIELGHEAVVTLFLEHGVDPDLPNHRESAIGHAITYHQSGIMEILLRHGAHIYPENLGSAEVFAPEHIATAAKEFPVHSISKRDMYPSLYNAQQHAYRMVDTDFGSTRRRLWEL